MADVGFGDGRLVKPGDLFAKARAKRDHEAAAPDDDVVVVPEKFVCAESAPSTSAASTARQAVDQLERAGRVADSAQRAAAATATGGGCALVVNRRRQQANPLLKYLRSVRYEWRDTLADFEMGNGACALYVTLKWHKLNPQYLETRFKDVGHSFALQVLLAVSNVEEPRHVLRELNVWCVRAGWTLIVAASVEEAAEYLEAFAMGQPAAKRSAPQSTDADDVQRAIGMLTSVRSVNRSDAQRLLGTFGSIVRIAQASVEQLSLCPGLGPHKAARLHDAFRTPLLSDIASANSAND